MDGGDMTNAERRSVTPIQNFSGKMSGSRNEKRAHDGRWDYERSVDASCCYWCRERFAAGQMRYPILHDWKCQPVSLCLDCFKHPDAESYDPAAMAANAEKDHDDFAAYLAKTNNHPMLALAPKRPKPRRIAPRQEDTCPGCGEPIFVSPELRRSLKFCSMRCYQRTYRKRRRETGSTIEWKNYEPPRKCAACKKVLKGKRGDTKFCSNRCRQWQYRRRGNDRA
jgi:predicted nucleic acid-binding Zn ribbon protein